MKAQCIPSSYSVTHRKAHRNENIITSSSCRSRQQNVTICFKSSTHLGSKKAVTWEIYAVEASEDGNQVSKEAVSVTKKKGTVLGAVALIVGTSIGSGILALPKKTAPAGLLPSSISMILCWSFLLIEALVLVEINVRLLRKNRKLYNDAENGIDLDLEVISIRTMAQETLGEWGGIVATVTYVFLGYASMVAYSTKSGEILCHLINLPVSVSGCFFTVVFAILISAGGTRTTDQVNQWLTASMIGLLLAIEILAVMFGGWSGVEGSGDWGKVPATIPVMIFSLVYHDLAPIVCAYLGGDLRRIRASVLIGSFIPLLAILVWDAIALGLSAHADQVVDPVELLTRVRWGGVSVMVEAFSLLAVGTSLIGTLLGFSQFFKEQLNQFPWNPISPSTSLLLQDPNNVLLLRQWWGRNKLSFAASAIVVGPTLFVSTTFPDAFSAATDIAGGYCMTMLYGVLPPAMAWAMQNRESKNNKRKTFSDTDGNGKTFSISRPALIGVGLFACGIVMEQLVQDLPMLVP